MEKNVIVEKLGKYITRKGGQNKAALSIQGISSATISQMINGNWDKISNEMWRKVEAVVGGKEDWVAAETITYKEMYMLLSGVQEDSRVMSIVAPAGTGKSFTAKCYEASHANVYRLTCDEFWSKNDFVEELLRAMGEKVEGYTKRERLDLACRSLEKKKCPLLIFDEWDKLSDPVWSFFITLYNRLEDRCGIVMLSTDYILRRINTGIKYNRRGYPEIWSRLGSKCINLTRGDYEDITLICQANGVQDEAVIGDIIHNSEGDMRKVRQLIFVWKRKRGAK